jgi:hypothetical protein
MNSIGEGETGFPNLIFPELDLPAEDYAHLRLRLDLYDDFVAATKFQDGQAQPPFMVDPAELAAALGGISLGSGVLPPETLFWSMVDGWPRIGVYLEERVWSLPVRDYQEALAVPLPPLVFIGHRYDYTVWAVTGRPGGPNTPVYVAPVPNVALDTGVCRGNAPFPGAGPGTIWQAVEVFFTSRFNQDLANGKSKAHPENVLEQWRALHQAQAAVYPPDDLVQTNLTIGRLIDVNPT